MFVSASHALDWAYNTAGRPILKMAMINRMRGPSCGHQNELLLNFTAQEAHSQAAQIIGIVENLSDPAAREYIAAKWGYCLTRSDLSILSYRGCAALGVGMDKREAVYRVMRGYFGTGVSIRLARKALGCRHQHAILSISCLYDVLDIIHDRSLAEMTQILERRGLIEREYA